MINVIHCTSCDIFNCRLFLEDLEIKTTFIVKGVDHLHAEVIVCCC